MSEFIKQCVATESVIDEIVVDKKRFLTTLELAISAGSLLDIYKKNIYYKKPIDQIKVGAIVADMNKEVSELTFGSARTAEELHIDTRIAHAIIGKFTENVELLELLADYINTGNFDTVNFGEELADDDWYTAIGLDAAGLSQENLRETLLAKLRLRNKGNTFNVQATINRDTDAERALLEEGITVNTSVNTTGVSFPPPGFPKSMTIIYGKKERDDETTTFNDEQLSALQQEKTNAFVETFSATMTNGDMGETTSADTAQ